MTPKSPMHGVLNINGERIPITSDTTALAILQWVWWQVESEARMQFLIEHLTPKERLALQFGCAAVEDEAPFLYRRGQCVQLPNHGGVGRITLQYLTRGTALSDVIEYDVACPDGEVVRQYEADLVAVEDAAS